MKAAMATRRRPRTVTPSRPYFEGLYLFQNAGSATWQLSA